VTSDEVGRNGVAVACVALLPSRFEPKTEERGTYF